MADINFTISRQEYLQLLTAILKKRRMSVINILVFLFMTVGQAVLVAVNIVIHDIGGGRMALLIAFSALIFAVQLFYQLSTGLRARVQLERSEKAGKISSEFWGRQRLSLKDDTLTLSCGKSRLSYDCAFFSGWQVFGSMLIVNFTKERTVHQLIIPLSALESCGGHERFVDMLSEARKESVLCGYAENGWERPENARYSVEFECSEKQFIRNSVRSSRMAYLTPAAWNLTAIAKLAGAAFLIYHSAAGSVDSLAFVFFSIFISIILLLRYIVTFTPLIYLMARKNTRSLFAGFDSIMFAVDVTEDKLIYSGTTFYNEMKLRDIRAVEETDRMAAVYLKDLTAVMIVRNDENRTEATRCILYLDSVAKSNRDKDKVKN